MEYETVKSVKLGDRVRVVFEGVVENVTNPPFETILLRNVAHIAQVCLNDGWTIFRAPEPTVKANDTVTGRDFVGTAVVLCVDGDTAWIRMSNGVHHETNVNNLRVHTHKHLDSLSRYVDNAVVSR